MNDPTTTILRVIQRLGGPTTIHEIAYQVRRELPDLTISELLLRLDRLAADGDIAATSYATPEVANNLEAHLTSLHEAALSVSRHPTVENRKTPLIRRGEGGPT